MIKYKIKVGICIFVINRNTFRYLKLEIELVIPASSE